MSKHSATDKDIRLRKWCVEQASKMTARVLGGDSLIKVSKDIYNWVTSKPQE